MSTPSSEAAPNARYVSMSAHGVGASRARAGRLFMGLVDMSNIGVAYRALAQAEDVIAASCLPWTIVRPSRLTNDEGTGLWRFTDTALGSRAQISRRDVARALVHLAEGEAHVHQAVTLTR